MEDFIISPFREGAPYLAQRGFRVHPVHAVDPETHVCTCKWGEECDSPGKRPHLKGWQHLATRNPYFIRKMDERFPWANVGVVDGRASGVAILDHDPRNGSEETFQGIVAEYGPLPRTPTVETGSGGMHQYFAYPEDYLLGSHLPVLPEGGGIDFKANGGQVVAPPSIHPSGNRYRWVVGLDEVPLAPLPEFLLQGVDRDPESEPPPDGVSAYAWKALIRECAAVREARSHRSNRLYEASMKLAGLIAGGSIDEDLCRSELEAAGVDAGLNHRRIEGSIDGGFRIGRQSHRKPPEGPRREAVHRRTEDQAVPA